MQNIENKTIGAAVKAIPSIAAVVIIIISIYAGITKPIQQLETQQALLKKDIETIKGNDLLHLGKDVSELKTMMNDRVKADMEMQNKIERILIILESIK
jgi:hypothetical protein